ncbi:hypothetical protein [Burkholderia lata]|uniref:hypothetical protein n=1 Tax=Burkholderia lata (strain ATCC 17760 / DSM 23089 / LMG 22485 / NCIMB 9086 / R18194 / 383) TaxID=482957 RepID=UPI00399C030A
MLESTLVYVRANPWISIAYVLTVSALVFANALKGLPDESRIRVSTLGLAPLLAMSVAPVYQDLAEQIPQGMPSWIRWLTMAFLYAFQGGSALVAGRLISKWIFAHANGSKRVSH